jgi:hypothetical protein
MAGHASYVRPFACHRRSAHRTGISKCYYWKGTVEAGLGISVDEVGLDVVPGTAGPWLGPVRTSWAGWVCCSGVGPVRTRLIRAQPEGSGGETDRIAKPRSVSGHCFSGH